MTNTTYGQVMETIKRYLDRNLPQADCEQDLRNLCTRRSETLEALRYMKAEYAKAGR